MKFLDKVLNVATRFKTPMSITSLAIIILYLITKQILSLNVFSEIGKDNTYSILSIILDYIFWFALVALVLGITSYLVTPLIKKK